jgi:hypothetical protein
MATKFDPKKYYAVSLSRMCEVMKTEYPANTPFKASGKMAQAFSEAGALAEHEEVGTEDDVLPPMKRTDNRLLAAGRGRVGVTRPDRRNLDEAVTDLPDEDREQYNRKMAKLAETGE